MADFVRLQLPALPPGWDSGLDVGVGCGNDAVPQLPPELAGLQGGLFQDLFTKMMDDLHEKGNMSEEEKTATLRIFDLPVPFAGGPGRTLRLIEDPKGVLVGRSTGSVVWAAALGLMEHLDREVFGDAAASPGARPTRHQRQPRRPSSAIELGAGTGAVGMYLAALHGVRTVVTDVPECLSLLERSVEECASHHGETGAAPLAVEARPLRWGDPVHLAPFGCFDLVVGSDVTYRPECLAGLLQTAAVLLSQGGRFVLSLQDRPGELDGLEEACLGFGAKITAKRLAEVDERAAEQTSGQQQVADCGGGKVPVWICEIQPRTTAASKADGGKVGSSAAEVEAEFERITGIRPEPLLPPEFERLDNLTIDALGDGTKTRPNEPAARSARTKEGVVREMLGRGLGDFLCEADEDLAARLREQPPALRPRTVAQKKAYAQAFYDGREPPPEALPRGPPHSGLASLDPEELEGVMAVERAIEEDAARPAVANTAGAAGAVQESSSAAAEVSAVRARRCLLGVTWCAEVDAAGAALTTKVVFEDDAWRALQGQAGAEGGGSTFREAVDFQVSDDELCVRHAGAPVLELVFARAIVSSSARAKLDSKRRRVTITAPLLAPSV